MKDRRLKIFFLFGVTLIDCWECWGDLQVWTWTKTVGIVKWKKVFSQASVSTGWHWWLLPECNWPCQYLYKVYTGSRIISIIIIGRRRRRNSRNPLRKEDTVYVSTYEMLQGTLRNSCVWGGEKVVREVT